MAFILTFAFKTLSSLCGQNVKPFKAGFNHPMSTEMIIKYESVLGCQVFPYAKTCYLIYNKKCAYLPVKTRNADLMVILDQHVAEVQKRIDSDSTFSMTVKNVMIENSKIPTPTIQRVTITGCKYAKPSKKVKGRKHSFTEPVN